MAAPEAAEVDTKKVVTPIEPVPAGSDVIRDQPVPPADTSRQLLTDNALATGNDIRITPGTVSPGVVTITPEKGEPIKGIVTKVGNANLLTTANNDVYTINTGDKGADKGTIESITLIKRDGVPILTREQAPLEVKRATFTDTANNLTAPIVKITDTVRGATITTGGPENPLVTGVVKPEILSSSALPGVGFESIIPGKRIVAPVPTPEVTGETMIKVRALPEALQNEIGLHKGVVPVSALPAEGRLLVTDAIKAGTLRMDDGVYKGFGLKSQPYIRTEAAPVVLAGNVDVTVPKVGPHGIPDLSYKGTFPGVHGPDVLNPKGIGDGLPPWAVRNFGNHPGELVMRDPSKMPGFDLGGERGMRNMLEFWKGIQGLKPGDNLNSLFDMMNGKMSGRDLIRLSDFLSGQLGRKGSEALGMQDIMNLSTLFKGFGDRAGLNMQFGDSRSSLMMSFGLNGRFDFQIRFGALTLGFGDRGQSGLQQIGRLLFTSDGRQTQASLGTGALRAGDILSRSFAGQGQGQWNPFGPSTGDGALRTTQLTARLTQGNQDFISQMRDNSARLTQQLDASKLAQMSKTPSLLPGDLKPGQLDPGGKGQILQNFDPLRQDAGKLQPGQRLDGPKILTGNIEMDARTMDGMGGRRGPLTAAAHEASMKGDLQNLQGKGDQMLPGAKLPGEKLTVEEEAAKKKLEEEKKKGDLRSGEQFIQDEQERKAKERREQEEDREEELEALSEQDEAKRRALLLILEARRKREKELKEKALKEQITKQEEAKRAQYRVAIGDSLENIATKQLRNPRLAGLIFDINKKVVPIKFMNGKEVAVLNVGAILSLPSVKEIKDFSQAGFTLGPKFNKVDFTMPAVSQQGKTAEDELEAMFGSNWHGTEAGEGQSDLSQNVPQNGKSQEEMDEFTKRRLNIESVLGQMGPKRAADGRMRYTVRLGDTLKSIAMKHPALEDVSSWRLLAELNNFSTETDANDNPKAIVPRGSVLMIPTRAEVEEHKRKMGLRKAIVLPGQSVTTGSALPSLKHCPSCGQKSLHTATTCECGSEFVSDSVHSISAASNTGAPYMVNQENQSLSQEATNNFLAGTPSKKEDRFELAAKSGHVDGDHWSDVANLDPETRIVKLNSVFDPSLEFSLLLLQALVGERWLPVAGYEMRENAAIRIDYTDAKSRSTVKIDLPPSAAQDLAKNDLIKNWQNYKRKFVTILPS
ncbi:LysM peptidoglycan-binding domain-containing protein [bacterium]|nr:LysM peptidoglycan-binding domain-containing protein [bacterium]